MKKTALRSAKTDASLTISELERNAEGWLLDGDIRQHSNTTLDTRRLITDKLLWFLRTREIPQCGTTELRQFLAYLNRGHKDAGGRWGNARLTQPVRPSTVHTYHNHLRAFFHWAVEEGVLDASPLDAIAAPIARSDQIEPFSTAQVKALLSAAKRSNNARRDEAICLLLLDTGIRASELCSLRMNNLDLTARRCTVMGKGNKSRSVYFSGPTAKAMWNYLRDEAREPEQAVFLADRGNSAGEQITRSGLLQLMGRLGKVAQVQATRCSPHTWRHTFAVEFLRGGGSIFSLCQLLGHTDIKMCKRYVALAEADVENQHRHCSPVQRLKGRTS